MRSSRSRSGTSCAFRPVHGEGTRPARRASRSSSSARPTSARTREKTWRVSETGGLTERRSVDGQRFLSRYRQISCPELWSPNSRTELEQLDVPMQVVGVTSHAYRAPHAQILAAMIDVCWSATSRGSRGHPSAARSGLELRLLGRAGQRGRVRVAAGDHERYLLEVPSADLLLVLDRGEPCVLRGELALLQVGVGRHALVAIAAGQLEHRVVERVEARQRDELESVAHLPQPFLELGDLLLGELALPVERR